MALRKSIVHRFTWVYLAVCLLFLLAVGRMAVIMTVEREQWMETARIYTGRKDRTVEPERGNIYSDNGQLISATIPYYSLYMDTKVEALHAKGGKLYKENIDSLCICLSRKFGDKTPGEYRRMINNAYLNGNRRLKISPHRVSYIDWQEIKQFPLFRLGRNKSGLYQEEFANRENLYGTLAARTVGDIYGNGQGGQYGIELFYDSLLSGIPGMERGLKVGGGWVYVPEKEPESGCDIVTTIDIDIQDICETALRHNLEKFNSRNGCLVLMEVKTGEVKAMVNLGRMTDGSYRESWNMAVADMSEPGSTFKTMSLMIALDHGVCDTADRYNINHGQWMFGSTRMTDHNWQRGGYDTLNVSQILAYSSNVGTSRIIDENYKGKAGDFVDAILATKFADDIGIEIPGATPPRIPHPDTYRQWSRISLPWMSIGYVVQVPPLYTLNFYNAIANNGRLMKPYLVKRIVKDGKVIVENNPAVINSSICKTSTLRKLQAMLEDVTEYGTAKRNSSKELKIAGKTGTAQLGYGRGGTIKHQVSFCGYFPADDPLYSCIVVIKEPQAPPAAAYMSGEVFHNVAERVYAQKVNKEIERLPRWKGDSAITSNLPHVKAGRRIMVEDAMDAVDIDFSREKGDWVSISKDMEQGEMAEKVRPILDNIVPNVIGMGATDALYLMERTGMHVQIYGKGRVVSQSVSAGQNVQKGKTVVLTLR